ncbi:hypothetical protein CH063_06831, partial [Colletotrichum higginsianum]
RVRVSQCIDKSPVPEAVEISTCSVSWIVIWRNAELCRAFEGPNQPGHVTGQGWQKAGASVPPYAPQHCREPENSRLGSLQYHGRCC